MKTATLQAHLTAAKELLERTVADDEPFFPSVLVLRDGILIAQIMPPTPPEGGDPGLTVQRVAQLAADGYGADEVVIVMDTYQCIGEAVGKHPITGQGYVSGDLENLATQHDGIAKGWVTDALTVLVTPRDPAAEAAMWALPYLRQTDRTVTWGDPDEEIRGRLTHLYEPTPMDGRKPDLIATQLLSSIGCTVALAMYEDNRS